jgi:uncharacterized protein (UPF0548 family)
MFLTHRPSQKQLEDFVNQSRELSLSYEPIGLAKLSPTGFSIDEASGVLGRGLQTFEQAKLALSEWRHYELGWVEIFPRGASLEPGTVVAVLVRHLGFWSLNGCRVVYGIGDRETGPNFGFAYGALTNHAENGEETFEVVLAPETEAVVYKIRAVSKPRALLARVGFPIARVFQERFRRDSIRALQRAVNVARASCA